FLGLAGWLALLAAVFAMLRTLQSAAAIGYEPLGIYALYGLYGSIVTHSLVIEVSHFRHFWMVLAMIAAATWQAARFAPEPAEVPVARSAPALPQLPAPPGAGPLRRSA